MPKAKLGSGARFKALSNKVAKEYPNKSASERRRIGAAVAAEAGARKYGKSKMTKMAVAGRKRK